MYHIEVASGWNGQGLVARCWRFLTQCFEFKSYVAKALRKALRNPPRLLKAAFAGFALQTQNLPGKPGKRKKGLDATKRQQSLEAKHW